MRYLRLYAYFLRFSFSRAMEFRIDFFFRIVMDVVWNAMYLTFFSVIFMHTEMLGGWNYDQILVFTGTLFVADAIQMTVFSNNMWWLPIFVNKGDLDYYLVRPVSTLFMLSLRDFAANSFLNLLIAIGILTWAIGRYPEPIGGGTVALFLFLVLVGAFLNYAIGMLFLSTVFWTHNADGAKQFYWTMGGTASRPHRIYRGLARRILTTILPFSLVASYPVDSLFSGEPVATMAYMLLVATVVFAALLFVWRCGLRVYASASS